MSKFIADREVPLEEAAAQIAPNSSKTTLKKWLVEGRLLLDGRPLRSLKGVMQTGSTLELGKRVQFLESGIKIFYEDNDLVVVEKPEGLLSVATAFEKGDTLHAILKRHYMPRKVQVVHRLDQDTSGVMVFALSDMAFDRLKEMFASHQIDREYEAIIEGHLKEPKGVWSCYLYEDQAYKVHVVEDEKKGQLAVTHYEVAAESRRFSRLRLRLETGRKNQIRVHCQQSGHSVVGDKKYGSVYNILGRLALHTALLGFQHPRTGKKLLFRSHTPDSFMKLVPK